MKIVTAAQMRALDQAAIQERGIPSLQPMDRAAAAVTERCLARLAGGGERAAEGGGGADGPGGEEAQAQAPFGPAAEGGGPLRQPRRRAREGADGERADEQQLARALRLAALDGKHVADDAV